MKIETIKEAMEYKKGHINLIKWGLNKGYSIKIEGKYNEDDDLETTNDLSNILKFLYTHQLEEFDLYIVDTENFKTKAWAWIIPSNDDEDIVIDFSDNKFMDEWENQFSKLHEELNK